MRKPDINQMWIVTTVYQDSGLNHKSTDYQMIEAPTEDAAKARALDLRPDYRRSDHILLVTCNHPVKLYEEKLLSFKATIRMDERGVDYYISKTVIEAESKLPVICMQLWPEKDDRDLYQLSCWVPRSLYPISLYARLYEENKTCDRAWHLNGVPSKLKPYSGIETFVNFIPHAETTINGCLPTTKTRRAEQLKEIEQYMHQEMLKRVTAYTQSLMRLQANIQQKMEY